MAEQAERLQLLTRRILSGWIGLVRVLVQEILYHVWIFDLVFLGLM